MPASSLRGLWIAFEANSSQRRPSRRSLKNATNSSKVARPRVPHAASEHAVLRYVETSVDGTITYSFGDETQNTQNGHSKEHIIMEKMAEISIPTSADLTPELDENIPASTSPTTHAPATIEQAAAHLDKILHLSHNGSTSIEVPPIPVHRVDEQQISHAISHSNVVDNTPKLEHSIHTSNHEFDPTITDFSLASASDIERKYSQLCGESRLDDALNLIKECIRAGRLDVFGKLKHYEFLRPAARQLSVRRALRFVQLLPRQFVDARTYNMVLTVCSEAGDVKNALRTADMMRAVGIKLDTILYTNLIKVCAAAGDADHAFEIYEEMKSLGVKVEKQVYATLVSACAAQISATPASDRRSQLVLLERAFGLIDNMDKLRIQPDAAVWNALVTAAGRGGQLQRAFSVVEEMIGRSSRPNGRTYAALIDACARGGDKEMALRVYKKALREGFQGELPVYSAAINACVRAHDGADLETAMSIYNDAQKNDVAPDSAFFGALMMASGRAGDLDLTLDLHAEMEREGLKPCVGTESALMTVYVQNDKLVQAQEIYHRMRSQGIVPHLHAWNALINAHARAMRLGDVVSLVSDMMEANVAPDSFTFAGILTACHRCEECELALDVYRTMRLRKVKLDEVHTKLLLHICLFRLRAMWSTLGPSSSVTSVRGRRAQEGAKLISSLTPVGYRAQVRDPALEVHWQAHAFHIYREAIADGMRPSLNVINVMLSCLRVPKSIPSSPSASNGVSYTGNGTGYSNGAVMPGMYNGSIGTDTAHQSSFSQSVPSPGSAAALASSPPSAPVQQYKIGIESIYHVQAISIIEEAIVSGHLPSFQADGAPPYDLREFPPAVAEVYALTVISALQRQVESRRRLKNRAVFLVPRYDGRRVFMPSHVVEAQDIATFVAAAKHTQQQQQQKGKKSKNKNGSHSGSFDDEDDYLTAEYSISEGFATDESSPHNASLACEKTGMGVAAVLRRLRLWAREHSPEGLLVLEPREIARWSKMIQREVEKRSASALALQKPYGQAAPGTAAMVPGVGAGNSLMAQSRNIRAMEL